jgi:hypothetical protein
MSAIFYAASPDIREEFVIPKNLDVAPTFMRILGIAPAETGDGHALEVIVK